MVVGAEVEMVIVRDWKRFLSSSAEADPLFATCQHPHKNGKTSTAMGWPRIEDSFEDA